MNPATASSTADSSPLTSQPVDDLAEFRALRNLWKGRALPWSTAPVADHGSGFGTGKSPVRVLAIACSRRQAAILSWCPLSSTSGTSSPRQLGGLV